VKRLPRSFYARPTLLVARALLGQRLVRVLDAGHAPGRLAGCIVEVEAYTGADDAASHAYRGPTPRNAPMFGPPGHAYVYFIYGVHWMFNVVAHQDGPGAAPGAVLVRALLPQEGLAVMRERRGGRPDRDLANGPARLAQALGIDGRLNGVDLCAHPQLFIEPGTSLADEAVACGPRVGVGGDELAQARPWRFWLRDEAQRR
jgi:DNA-3-methyladenine glycosylase